MTNFNDLMLFRKKKRTYQWRKEWQDKLSVILEAATGRLKMNLVFVVAEESDPYSELLFLFSFVGVSLGSFLGLAFKVFNFDPGLDLYVFPLLGFTGIGLFHTRKSFWLRRLFQNLAEKRVQQKARSYFYEYHSNPAIPMILVYISESEDRIEVLRTPELIQRLSPSRIEELQKNFHRKYTATNPLLAIEDLVNQLVTWLAQGDVELSVSAEERAQNFSKQVFVPASDFEIKFVPVLKGNKDVN